MFQILAAFLRLVGWYLPRDRELRGGFKQRRVKSRQPYTSKAGLVRCWRIEVNGDGLRQSSFKLQNVLLKLVSCPVTNSTIRGSCAKDATRRMVARRSFMRPM